MLWWLRSLSEQRLNWWCSVWTYKTHSVIKMSWITKNMVSGSYIWNSIASFISSCACSSACLTIPALAVALASSSSFRSRLFFAPSIKAARWVISWQRMKGKYPNWWTFYKNYHYLSPLLGQPSFSGDPKSLLVSLWSCSHWPWYFLDFSSIPLIVSVEQTINEGVNKCRSYTAVVLKVGQKSLKTTVLQHWGHLPTINIWLPKYFSAVPRWVYSHHWPRSHHALHP